MATIARDSIIVEFIAKTDQFRRDRKKALAESDRDAQKTAGRFSRIADIAGGFLSANLLQGAISGLGQLGAKALDLSKNYEQTLVSFELFTGSLENAEALVTKLDKFSLKTPFEPTEVNAAAKTLLGFGRSADIVLEDLELIGNAAAASGSDLGNLALVFGQVAGAGKLQGQDALQLINAGIPVYQLLSESLGVSVAQVKELQGQGKITFETLREGFAKASAEGGKFEGALIKQSKTFAGLVSTAKGAFDAVLRNAGDALLPVIKEILPPVINGLFYLVEVVKQAAVPVGGLLVSAFNALGQATRPYVEIAKDLFARLSSGGPILEKVALYLTLVAQQVAVGARLFKLLVTGVTSFFSALSGGNIDITGFLTKLSKVPAVIGGIIAVVESLPEAFTSAFLGGKQAVGEFVEDLLSLLNPLTLGKILTGKTSIAEVLAANERKRIAAGRVEFKAFGESIADAYAAGYSEIEKIKVELPEVDTKKATVAAKQKGKELGEETGKGIVEGLKKELAASSLAGLKEQISALEQIISELADPTGDGIENLKATLGEIEAKEKQLAVIEDLISRITGKSTGPSAIEALPDDISLAEKRLQELAKVALAKAKNAEKLATAQREQDALQVEALKEQGATILSNAKDLADQLIAVNEARIDREINLAQERLNRLLAVADQGNAEQLQLEEERLNKLQKQKEKAVQARQRLAAVEIAVNNAVAASESIKAITAAFAAGNIPLGIATAAALALTVASTVLTVANAFGDIPSFRVGTDYFDPSNPDRTGGALAMLHKGERVLTAEQNASLKTWGVGNDQIPGLVGLALGRINSPSVVNAVPAGSEKIERQLADIKQVLRDHTRAIKANRPNVILDEKGLYAATDAQAKKAQRKARLRRG